MWSSTLRPRDLFYNLVNWEEPVISAVHGHALGAGLGLAFRLRHVRHRPLIDETPDHRQGAARAASSAGSLWALLKSPRRRCVCRATSSSRGACSAARSVQGRHRQYRHFGLIPTSTWTRRRSTRGRSRRDHAGCGCARPVHCARRLVHGEEAERPGRTLSIVRGASGVCRGRAQVRCGDLHQGRSVPGSKASMTGGKGRACSTALTLIPRSVGFWLPGSSPPG